MKKLAIISTHPIQYNAPLFKLLQERNIIEIMVFYTWGDSVLINKFDPGFGIKTNIDKSFLENYQYTFVLNTAKRKGSSHFMGIINPTLIENIQTYNPTALLVYGWSFYSHLLILRHFRNKIPILFRGDSTIMDDLVFFKKLIRTQFLKWLYSNIDFALYVGKNNYDYYKMAGLNTSKLIYAPHAIDNERFEKLSLLQSEKVVDFRNKLQIPKNDFIFLYAGKFEKKKNVELLITAFMHCNFNQQVHLLLVGNGFLQNKLKNLALKNENIHFLDFQSYQDMPAVYDLSDVFILPSKGPAETWGLSVNEAMANGKPVIVSNKCGCAIDLIEDYKNGFIFESENKEDLSNKLLQLYSQRNSISIMKENAKNKIASYSFIKVAQAIEDIVVNL